LTMIATGWDAGHASPAGRLSHEFSRSAAGAVRPGLHPRHHRPGRLGGAPLCAPADGPPQRRARRTAHGGGRDPGAGSGPAAGAGADRRRGAAADSRRRPRADRAPGGEVSRLWFSPPVPGRVGAQRRGGEGPATRAPEPASRSRPHPVSRRSTPLPHRGREKIFALPSREELKRAALLSLLTTALCLAWPLGALAQEVAQSGSAINIDLGTGSGLTERVVQLVGLMTVLSLAPS